MVSYAQREKSLRTFGKEEKDFQGRNKETIRSYYNNVYKKEKERSAEVKVRLRESHTYIGTFMQRHIHTESHTYRVTYIQSHIHT